MHLRALQCVATASGSCSSCPDGLGSLQPRLSTTYPALVPVIDPGSFSPYFIKSHPRGSNPLYAGSLNLDPLAAIL
jgi:hypothetical protein